MAKVKKQAAPKKRRVAAAAATAAAGPPRARPRVAPRSRVAAPRKPTEREVAAKIELPTERKKPSTDPRDYTILLYAREKWGKTTFFSTFPETLFLCFEPGAQGVSIFEFNAEDGGVRNWSIARRAVDLIEAQRKMFKSVVFDTGDLAYQMCLECISRECGVAHPHDADDYGKTWNRVKAEFASLVTRIKRTGRGIYITSHFKSAEITSASGVKYNRISSSLTGQAEGVIHGLVDFIFFGQYMKDKKGNTRRVIVTQGDELIAGGQRRREGVPPLPRFLVLPPEEEADQDYECFIKAFRGEETGYEAELLVPGATMAKKVAELANKERLAELQARTGGGAGAEA